MSTPVTYAGNQYNIPAYQDTGYAQGTGNLSSYLIALATGSLTISGGTFALTADANFGANFGLVSIYFKSRSSNIASAGILRLANTDTIVWRDNANGNNLILAMNATQTGGGTYTIPDVGVGVSASFVMTAGTQSIAGAKTFTDPITQNDTANQLVLGVTRTVTITAPTPASASRTWTIPDISADGTFASLNGTQTFSGIKTFSSNLLVNATTPRVIVGDTPQTQIEGTTSNTSGFSLITNANSAGGSAAIYFGHSRGTSLGSVTTLQSGDTMGDIFFAGADGTGMVLGARIAALVDGSVGTNDMPGRLAFYTCADGTVTATERMRISNGGFVGIGTTNPAAYNSNAQNLIVANASGAVGMTLRCNTNSTNVVGFTDAEGTTLQGLIQYTHNATATSEILTFRVGGTDWWNLTGNGHWLPQGSTGTQNIGDASQYIGDLSYKTLTDRGCLGWFDDGVELPDGRKVTDTEAILAIEKDETKETVYGVPMLKYSSFPKVAYRKASVNGIDLPRDSKNEPMGGADGIEMTSMFSIMIGAIKELTNRVKTLEQK